MTVGCRRCASGPAGQGFRRDEFGDLLDGERIQALIAKTMIPDDGTVRGSRTTVYTSSWAPKSHIRAAASVVFRVPGPN